MITKTFYQEFLFADMNVTKEGYPNIEFEYCNYVADYKIMKLVLRPSQHDLQLV